MSTLSKNHVELFELFILFAYRIIFIIYYEVFLSLSYFKLY